MYIYHTDKTIDLLYYMHDHTHSYNVYSITYMYYYN